MIKSEWTGKTVDLAKEKGLKELGLCEEQVDIEIISQGGFLKQAKVAISKKPTEGEKAAEFLQQLLDKMKFNYIVEFAEDKEEIKLNLTGADNGAVIGRRGEVLDALQYIVSLVVIGDKKGYRRVVVDSENYRQKRSDNLTKLAKNLEKKVERTDRYVKLEPMNPAERRVIHSALQDSSLVKTTSVGEEPNRYVVIYPKDRPYKDKPYTERERYSSKRAEENKSYRKEGGKESSFRHGERRNAGTSNAPLKERKEYVKEIPPQKEKKEQQEQQEQTSPVAAQRKKLSFVYRSDKKKRRR